MDDKKITTGANDRARNETIAQTGPGLPDDSSRPPEVSDKDVERTRERLAGQSGGSARAGQQANTDRVPEGTPGSGENICRRCSGSGEIDGSTCPDCGGTGVVTTPVGGAG